MDDYNKPTKLLTEQEMWDIIEDMTDNMSEEEREEWLEGLGED